MNFPTHFYLTLLFLSPWPICYTLIFYFRYRWDTTFEYFITTKKQRYKYWVSLIFLPLICFSIFILRYKRMGISLDVWKLTNAIFEYLSPLNYIDLGILAVFMLLFLINWIFALRVVYQYFRKCILALYLYYRQYRKIYYFYMRMVGFKIDSENYLWARVNIFQDSETAFAITWYIWPIIPYILERNLFTFILPYIFVFDCLTQQGHVTKIFVILPWYYIYSLIRFALKFFFAIHTPSNGRLSVEMYGYPK